MEVHFLEKKKKLPGGTGERDQSVDALPTPACCVCGIIEWTVSVVLSHGAESLP